MRCVQRRVVATGRQLHLRRGGEGKSYQLSAATKDVGAGAQPELRHGVSGRAVIRGGAGDRRRDMRCGRSCGPLGERAPPRTEGMADGGVSGGVRKKSCINLPNLPNLANRFLDDLIRYEHERFV